MTEQEQNIAIAEACGWSLKLNPQGRRPLSDEGYTLRKNGDVITEIHIGGYNIQEAWNRLSHCLPDFHNDRNAMAQAKATLDPDGQFRERYEFAAKLRDIVCPHEPMSIAALVWYVANASVKDEAKAFLQVKGKWKD